MQWKDEPMTSGCCSKPYLMSFLIILQQKHASKKKQLAEVEDEVSNKISKINAYFHAQAQCGLF